MDRTPEASPPEIRSDAPPVAPFRRYHASRVALDPRGFDPDREWRVFDKKNGQSIRAGSELAARLAASILTQGEPRVLYIVAAEVLDEIAEAMPGLAVLADGFATPRAAEDDAADVAFKLRELATRIRYDFAPVSE